MVNAPSVFELLRFHTTVITLNGIPFGIYCYPNKIDLTPTPPPPSPLPLPIIFTTDRSKALFLVLFGHCATLWLPASALLRYLLSYSLLYLCMMGPVWHCDQLVGARVGPALIERRWGRGSLLPFNIFIFYFYNIELFSAKTCLYNFDPP